MKNLNTVQLDFGFDCKPVPIDKPIVKPNKNQKEDPVFDLMDCLTSPIIVFKSAWQDAIPRELLGKVTISRMMCLMKGEQMASITETVAYMMPRTFEAPLPTEWVNIYTWCGLQYAMLFNNENNRKDMVSAMKDIAPKSLTDYETGLLEHLRKWIYDKRRKALKDIMKANDSL